MRQSLPDPRPALLLGHHGLSSLRRIGRRLGYCIFLVVSLQACRALPVTDSFINTWLVLGPFDNDAQDSGFKRRWIAEDAVQPCVNQQDAGRKWMYFDDRLFSRNYDDYQDLYSYFHIRLEGDAGQKVFYAHTYIFSPKAQGARLRLGADSECAAWVNGKKVADGKGVTWQKDSEDSAIELKQGWNSLLIKIANRENGRLGFYARLSRISGKPFSDLAYSVNLPGENLSIDTQQMPDVGSATMPAGWREWPYVGAHPDPDLICPPGKSTSILSQFTKNVGLLMQATDFQLLASGGKPPYHWSLAGEKELPPGLALSPDGKITGTIADYSELKAYPFTVRVSDSDGHHASKEVAIEVQERPNMWFEEARLVGLAHAPERTPANEFEPLAKMMKAQGYGLVMPISWNNGDAKFRWPSIYAPDRENTEDIVGEYKAALEKEGIKFGMYMGNLNIPDAPFRRNQQNLMVEDAIRRYRPAAIWFDWAGLDGEALDSLYSMIRALDPNLLIILNGHVRGSNGDWDTIVFEAWGAWGKQTYDPNTWPVPVPWPKKHSPEAWHLLIQPDAPAPLNGESNWMDYLGLAISLIGEGFVADIDHSVTLASQKWRLKTLMDSPLMQYHQQIADWANPKGVPPLYLSYTQVNPGPLNNAAWGYNMVNLKRDIIYIHMMKNPRGKVGMPSDGTITVGPVEQKVKAITWMNASQPLTFSQRNTSTDRTITIDLSTVKPDPVDTILKVELESPLPGPTAPASPESIPSGNLASFRPSRILSLDGTRELGPSSYNYARYGVDGDLNTGTAAGGEYPWTYEVDLQSVYSLGKVVVTFLPDGFPTEYEILISDDRLHWTSILQANISKGGTYPCSFPPADTRFIRVRGIKPNAPGQTGAQMFITELEAYRPQ